MYYDHNSDEYRKLNICTKILNYIKSNTNIGSFLHSIQRTHDNTDNVLNFWMNHNYAAFANFGYGIIDKNGNTLNDNADTIASSIINVINTVDKSLKNIQFRIKVNDLLAESKYGCPPPFVYFCIDKIVNEYIKNRYSLPSNAKQTLKKTISELKTRQKIVIYISSAHYNKVGKGDPEGRYHEYLWSRLFGDLLQATLTKLGFTAIKVFPESAASSKNPHLNESSRIELHRYRGRRSHIINNCLKNINTNNKIISIGICPHSNGSLGGRESRGATVYTVSSINNCDILASCILNYFGYYGILHNTSNPTKPIKNNAKVFSSTNVNTSYESPAIDVAELNSMIKDGTIISILSENLFSDNTEDIKLLCSREGNRYLVTSHILGIIDFLTKQYVIYYNKSQNKVTNEGSIVKNEEKVNLTDITEATIKEIFNNLEIATFENFEKESYSNGDDEASVIASLCYSQLSSRTINDNIIRSIISGWGYYEKIRLNEDYGALGTQPFYNIKTKTVSNGLIAKTDYESIPNPQTNWDGKIGERLKFMNFMNDTDKSTIIFTNMQNNLYNAIIY